MMKDRMVGAYKFLDRVIAGVVLIFLVVIVLLAVSLIRHARLQQAVSESSLALRDNVEVLQETAGELQETIEQLRTQAPDDSAVDRHLATLDESLSQMDEQLGLIEQAIDEVAPRLNEEDAPVAAPEPTPGVEDVVTIQGEIHWLFTAAAWLIGATSVLTAIAAFMVFNPLRIRGRRRRLLPLQPRTDAESRDSL
jgi:cell division protein FtsB